MTTMSFKMSCALKRLAIFVTEARNWLRNIDHRFLQPIASFDNAVSHTTRWLDCCIGARWKAGPDEVMTPCHDTQEWEGQLREVALVELLADQAPELRDLPAAQHLLLWSLIHSPAPAGTVNALIPCMCAWNYGLRN